MNRHPQSAEANTRRFGKGMIVAAWVLLLALLTLAFQSVLERQNNPNRKPLTQIDVQGVREVILHRNRVGHYLASGYINGSKVTFLLDTGATDVAIPEALASSLGLKRGLPFVSKTANGTVTSWRTRLDEVRIGTIGLTDIRASILPSMGGMEVLLGMSFLQQLELVQRDGTLTLRQY